MPLIAEGRGKGRRYQLPRREVTARVEAIERAIVGDSVEVKIYPPNSPEAKAIKQAVRAPIQERQPVGYMRSAINLLAKQRAAPVQACATGSLMTLIWQQRSVIGELHDDLLQHRLNIAANPVVQPASMLFWFFMLLRHDFLAGSPRLDYLTLPMVLSDADCGRLHEPSLAVADQDS